MWVPSDDEIRALHERHAPSREAFDLVYTHCRIVWRIAEQLLARPGGPAVDARLVRAGCLLHDIGVYRLYDAAGALDHAGYIRHGVLGHELLREAGLPEAVCRFCSCHTGVGVTREDVVRQGLPIPPGDYVAETEEERLVMHADKFHSKSSPPRFVTAAEYTRAVRRFGEDKAALFTSMVRRYGEPDLTTGRLQRAG
ncbi:HD domain-containing protein [Dactylosporangium sp. NBC_01737]|uniref:HD domain-containing protein n=1 Tax=Dactylosporangium sp. NBC_01737 TaxID=2975959 RepID=UPI002E13F3AA|nr:HD domain-containing protein [Dactylosporangium sp. NBC_01737]